MLRLPRAPSPTRFRITLKTICHDVKCHLAISIVMTLMCINLVADLGDWTATLATERYVAKEKYSAYKVSQPSTALVSYVRVSLGIN